MTRCFPDQKKSWLCSGAARIFVLRTIPIDSTLDYAIQSRRTSWRGSLDLTKGSHHRLCHADDGWCVHIAVALSVMWSYSLELVSSLPRPIRRVSLFGDLRFELKDTPISSVVFTRPVFPTTFPFSDWQYPISAPCIHLPVRQFPHRRIPCAFSIT